jgi:hypothetical protein
VGSLKIFSKTIGSISTRLGTNCPWIKGIKICSKERESPIPRGDNNERVKIHRKFLKILFSRTSWPKSIKLGTNYSWVKKIQVSSNKRPGPLQRGDNHKIVKMGWSHLKIFFSRTTGPILIRLGTNHPWREREDSSVFKGKG